MFRIKFLVLIISIIFLSNLSAYSQEQFRRGDSNINGKVDISDSILNLSFLYLGEGEIHCQDAADANDDGKLDVSDPITILHYLFIGGLILEPPGPFICGVDRTTDSLGCSLYDSCEPKLTVTIKGQASLPSDLPATKFKLYAAGKFVTEATSDGVFSGQGLVQENKPFAILVRSEVQGELYTKRFFDFSTERERNIDLGNFTLEKGGGFHFRKTLYQTGLGTSSIATGDIDNDGDIDIITANEEDRTFSLLLNEGNGSLATAKTFKHTSFLPKKIHLLDLNKDSFLDVILENTQHGGIQSFLGDGKGQFNFLQELDLTSSNNNQIEFSDLNNDGNIDGAYIGCSFGYSLLEGNSSGEFEEIPCTEVGEQFSLITSGDINNDTVTDLVFYSRNAEKLFVYLGGQDLTFNLSNIIEVNVDNWLTAIHLKDLNRDGNLDLILKSFEVLTQTIFSLYGDGKRNFETINTLVSDVPITKESFHDYNLDGNLDILVTNSRKKSASLYFGNEHNNFKKELEHYVGFMPQNITAANLFDKSGLEIIVANSGSGNISILTPDENQSYGNQELCYNGNTGSPSLFYDVDQNNLIDFVARGGTSSELVVRYDYCNEDSSEELILSLPHNFDLVQIRIHDINFDGLNDLILLDSRSDQNRRAELLILLGKEDRTFKELPTISVGDRPNNLFVNDLNGDGIYDLTVSYSRSGFVSIYFGLEDLQFDEERTITLPKVNFSHSTLIDIKDVNFDNYPDFLIYNEPNNSFDVLLGDTNNKFESLKTTPLPEQVDRVEFGDLNHDRHPDFVIRTDGGSIIFMNEGDGTFNQLEQKLEGYYITKILDFDGDEKIDLISTHWGGAFAIHLGKGDGTFWPIEGGFGREAGSVFLDFNNDGALDVLAKFFTLFSSGHQVFISK